MGEMVHIPRTKDECSAKLKRIPSEPVLAMASRASPSASDSVVSAQQMQQRSFLQLQSTIGLTLFVNEQREADTGFLTKRTRILSVAQPYCRYVCSALPKFVFMVAQLRDVLPAKNSTIVPQEDQNDSSISPQGTDPYFPAISIRQHNGGKRAAIGIHTETFLNRRLLR